MRSVRRPTWDKFLDRITGGDVELIAFLQRMAGYALTGLTREHALFFLYGTGANGKTTFLGAIIALRQRLPPHRAHRDLHRDHRRTSPDRSRRVARRTNS